MSKFKPNSTYGTHQGTYKLQNVSKYIGDPTEVFYRSSWELKFMKYCDLTPGVMKWGAEVFKIPYVDRLGHNHNYIPDFYLETRNVNNSEMMNRFLVEIKPEKETIEPVIPVGNISEKQLKRLEWEITMWQKNKHKWAYATEWCKSRDIKFWIVNESNLKSFNV